MQKLNYFSVPQTDFELSRIISLDQGQCKGLVPAGPERKISAHYNKS